MDQSKGDVMQSINKPAACEHAQPKRAWRKPSVVTDSAAGLNRKSKGYCDTYHNKNLFMMSANYYYACGCVRKLFVSVWV